MSRRDGFPLSYYERKAFGDLTNGLDAGIDASMEPTDGWDVASRSPSYDSTVDSSSQDRAYIPCGHIAFMGDFESVEVGLKES